ncbi:helix-turn-helix transcriptional regulator [Quisquiliibacterium transsilvanicum]|uniref:Excisionase family DNA binding protein n=1 Tax=Quisquiliibacterium transsilvanicum TaxID=1549638 RepID=A0A7W8HK58_9BURK|nr:helix-turn-helix transcriptional regulator [Quisquiliibacterium transsilvanicum]MBB5273556.1 excisionase family DNA binding protein [Quisquiliibacterium transsilvanicum]
MTQERWLTTGEAAELMRMRPRTLYHLVQKGLVPHARAHGRLLFDPAQLHAWLASRSAGTPDPGGAEPPATIAGSHDPLLERAVRDSGSGLALATVGSLEGLGRFAARGACAALLHVPDSAGDGFNGEVVRQRFGRMPVVCLHWARREQGLIVAAGNPLGIGSLADLARRRHRLVLRQPGAGSQLLLAKMLREAGIDAARLRGRAALASTETEVAETVKAGLADAGFGIRAAAHRDDLGFVPLAWESADLVVWRRSVFEPPMQALLAFTRTRAFARHARALTGYDVAGCGSVLFNA